MQLYYDLDLSRILNRIRHSGGKRIGGARWLIASELYIEKTILRPVDLE